VANREDGEIVIALVVDDDTGERRCKRPGSGRPHDLPPGSVGGRHGHAHTLERAKALTAQNEWGEAPSAERWGAIAGRVRACVSTRQGQQSRGNQERGFACKHHAVLGVNNGTFPAVATPKPLLIACALVAVAASVAACSGSDGDDSGPAGEELRRLVLQPEDLPDAFARFDEGRLNRLDFRPGPRESRTRFGRRDGWKARYKRSGDRQTSGPLVVNSQVDLFGDEEGAEQDLEAYQDELEPAWSTLPAPTLGDRAVAMTLRQGSGRFAVRHFTVAWRDGRSTASVRVNGFEGKVLLRDTIALARKQQARLRRL
jgi:hypothetical protein